MLRQPRLYLLLLLALTLIAAGGWWYYSTRPEYRFQRARQALARGDFPTADAHAEALEAAGEFDRAEFLRGESLMLSGHFADALKHFNQIEDQGALRREAILLSGRCLLHLHSLSEAIRAFAFVLTEDPDAVDAHRGLAAATYDLGQMGYALEHLEQVARLDDRDGKCHRMRGVIFKDRGNYPKAEIAYRAALARDLPDEDRRETRAELAYTLIRLARYAEALALLDEQPEETPTPTEVALRSDALSGLGRPNEALPLLERTLKRYPNNPLLWLVLGQAQLEQGKPQAAVSALRRAAELAPDDYQTLSAFARALATAGQHEASQQQQKKAEQIRQVLDDLTRLSGEAAQRPWDSAVRLQLAELCEKMGRTQLAAIWRQAAQECGKKPKGM